MITSPDPMSQSLEDNPLRLLSEEARALLDEEPELEDAITANWGSLSAFLGYIRMELDILSRLGPETVPRLLFVVYLHILSQKQVDEPLALYQWTISISERAFYRLLVEIRRELQRYGGEAPLEFFLDAITEQPAHLDPACVLLREVLLAYLKERETSFESTK